MNFFEPILPILVKNRWKWSEKWPFWHQAHSIPFLSIRTNNLLCKNRFFKTQLRQFRLENRWKRSENLCGRPFEKRAALPLLLARRKSFNLTAAMQTIQQFPTELEYQGITSIQSRRTHESTTHADQIRQLDIIFDFPLRCCCCCCCCCCGCCCCWLVNTAAFCNVLNVLITRLDGAAGGVTPAFVSADKRPVNWMSPPASASANNRNNNRISKKK